MPGAVLVAVAGTAAGVVVIAGVAGFAACCAGAELSGAPTAISQRWPGCPCGGLVPAATGTVPAGTAAVVAGMEKLSVVGTGAGAVAILSCFITLGVPRLGSVSGSLSLLPQAANSKQVLIMRMECFILMCDV